MYRIAITDEQRVTVESLSLEVFTTMTNAGASLQETLAAIYLTGFQNAAEAAKGRTS
jgi:hypothetical protein